MKCTYVTSGLSQMLPPKSKLFYNEYIYYNVQIMGPIKCEIHLKKASKIYFTSETVQGTVHIWTKCATNFSKMELSLIGQGKFANSPWTDDKIPVYTETKCVQLDKILPSGTAEFPISWPLPWDLVPSLKWKSASVTYHFLARIATKVKGTEEEEVTTTTSSIEIHNPIDLSRLPVEYRGPQEYTAGFRPKDGGASSVREAISLRFTLNRKCFIPGEQLRFNCAVTGLRDLPIRRVFRGITVTLDEELTYFKGGDDPGKCLITNIAKKRGGSSAVIQKFPDYSHHDSPTSRTSSFFWDDSIKIPNTCNSSPILGVVGASYFLNVEISLPPPLSRECQDSKTGFRMGIVIGGIPLEEPLRCEMQMALLTSRRPSILLSEEDNEVVQDDEDDLNGELEEYFPHEMVMELDPPPDLDSFFNRSETPPPSYTTAIQMTQKMQENSLNNDSPPKYVP